MDSTSFAFSEDFAMSQSYIRKGMVLCAGLGTRLLPITQIFPKPLVPLANIANIVHSLSLLRRAGIRDVIINLHHLSQSIENYLKDGSAWGMNLSYSEENILLGTGGGLKKAESFFQGEPFVLANCDFITNIELLPLVETHFRRNALATMILIEDKEKQAAYAKVGCDLNGNLCSLPKLETKVPVRTAIFTGIHILGNEVLPFLMEQTSGINEVLYPRLMKEFAERTYCDFVEKSYWLDTGEISLLWKASVDLLGRLKEGDLQLRALIKENGGYEELKPGVWVAEGKILDATIDVNGPTMIGKDCDLGAGASIGPYSVIGDNALIGPRAHVTRSVILPGGVVPEGQHAVDTLIFNRTALPIRGIN
jgi:NDP-sugar pyrophosphorylase family protein